jgi:hypothetical protein
VARFPRGISSIFIFVFLKSRLYLDLQAYYRSREEWNSLIEEAGFIRVKETDSVANPKASGHYNSAASSVLSLDKVPRKNVIKAYYAVYAPNKSFQFIQKQQKRKIDEISSVIIQNEKSLVNSTTGSDITYESKKHPGRYYKINPNTGAAEWLT